MVQLELDPRYIQVERTAEIELHRITILRRRVTGGSGEWRKEKRFTPISFDVALSSLLNSSYSYLRRQTNTKGYELDLLVGQALKKSLPYLQGEKGDFESFNHFKWRMFMSIVENLGIDHFHSNLRSRREMNKFFPSEIEDLEVQLPAETRKKNAEGFQPTLFRLSQEQTRAELAIEQLLADLKNPDGVLGLSSDYLKSLPRYTQRALELRWQNTHFTSGDVVEVLRLEGYRKFNESTIRVWELRAKRAQRQKQLTGI